MHAIVIVALSFAGVTIFAGIVDFIIGYRTQKKYVKRICEKYEKEKK